MDAVRGGGADLGFHGLAVGGGFGVDEEEEGARGPLRPDGPLTEICGRPPPLAADLGGQARGDVGIGGRQDGRGRWAAHRRRARRAAGRGGACRPRPPRGARPARRRYCRGSGPRRRLPASRWSARHCRPAGGATGGGGARACRRLRRPRRRPRRPRVLPRRVLPRRGLPRRAVRGPGARAGRREPRRPRRRPRRRGRPGTFGRRFFGDGGSDFGDHGRRSFGGFFVFLGRLHHFGGGRLGYAGLTPAAGRGAGGGSGGGFGGGCLSRARLAPAARGGGGRGDLFGGGRGGYFRGRRFGGAGAPPAPAGSRRCGGGRLRLGRRSLGDDRLRLGCLGSDRGGGGRFRGGRATPTAAGGGGGLPARRQRAFRGRPPRRRGRQGWPCAVHGGARPRRAARQSPARLRRAPRRRGGACRADGWA